MPETVMETSSMDLTPSERESIQRILTSMLAEQSDHCFYKFSEGYLKYRMVVSDWMVDVAEFFSLHPTTTHAAVAYLDRLQPNEKFSRVEWQMLAISCLLISSKYNEMEESVPSLRKLELITQQTISNSSILNYELWALKRMGWKLNARTPMSFLYTFMNLGVVFPQDKFNFLDMSSEDLSGLIEEQCTVLATKCMLDLQFKPHQASAIATAILFQVRRECGIVPIWNQELTAMTTHDPYTDKAVLVLLRMLQEYACSSFDNSLVQEGPETASEDASFSQDMLSSLSLSTTKSAESPASPAQQARPADYLNMITPANKENAKPLASELSPVSIANLDLA